MNFVFYVYLFILGAIFGSFSSVIIYRIKSNEPGILLGRSHCSTCNKVLQFFDLFPIFSWLFSRGKCRYCKEKVSFIYPILELTTGLLFALVGYFLIDFKQILDLNFIEIYKLIFFLLITFFSVIYVFYDILFLEIPEIILVFAIGITTIFLGIQTIFPQFNIISFLPSGTQNLTIGIYSIILSTIILGLLYVIMLKGLKEIYDLIILGIIFLLLFGFKKIFNVNLSDFAILNGIIGALIIFCFFMFQILVSKGEWIGGGDLRIAILIGLILGLPLALPGTMITYISGSIIGIAILIRSKIKNKSLSYKLKTQIPFGPFLAIGFFICIFQYKFIQMFIEKYF